MCKLTKEEFEYVYEALLASITLEDFGDAESVLEMQDRAFEIMDNAKVR